VLGRYVFYVAPDPGMNLAPVGVQQAHGDGSTQYGPARRTREAPIRAIAVFHSTLWVNKGIIAMTSITETVQHHPRFDARSKRFAFLMMGLSLTVTAVWLLTQSPISCERHRGASSNDFSSDFDINRIECQVFSVKHSPTIRFWGVAPYVGIDW
jgi:hypothetical protein